MRFSIHTKFFISLITLATISLASMGYVLLNDADKRLDEFKFIQAKSQTRTLAENSEEALLVKDYPLLENLVNVAKSEAHYIYASIVYPNGLIVSHTNIDLVGKKLPTVKNLEEISARTLVSQRGKIIEIIQPIRSGKSHLGNAHIAYHIDSKTIMANETISWLVKILIITLVFMAFGSVFITRHLTRPIVELTDIVNENATNNRLHFTADILSRKDEVGALANAFQYMSDQLVDRLEELEFQIEERDHARAANETKSNFLANISHELRTPLNAIIGYSELLQDAFEDDGNNLYEKDLNKISNSAIHLNSLIDDMLDLSKIESGKMEIEAITVETGELLDDISTTVKPLMKKNSNMMSCIREGSNDQVHADPLRLKQILLNLLSNAAKFTENGDICVRVSRDANTVSLGVSDTGIGMTEEQLAKVFDAFTQADKSTTIKYGGTGLGLTISRRFCQMMGGNITANSTPGVGSVFTITLPAATVTDESKKSIA